MHHRQCRESFRRRDRRQNRLASAGLFCRPRHLEIESARRHQERFRHRRRDQRGRGLPGECHFTEVKRATLIFLVLLALSVRAGDKKVDVSKIHGRIQFVNSFPDYKVQAVTSFADLHVQIVTSFPDKPGQWQIVESFPDYKIEMVNSFPDFTIQYVKSFPGPAK
jgi:hypothetical protein